MEIRTKELGKTHRNRIITVVVLLIFFILTTGPVFYALLESQLPIRSGTAFSIEAGGYRSFRVWVLTYSQLKGSFTATNNISFWIMESAQHYLLTYGHHDFRVEYWLDGVTSGTISKSIWGSLGEAYISFGTQPYYLVFYNWSSNSSTTVTITQTIALSSA